MRLDDLSALVDDFVAGHVADYQMAAWLATVCCTGLSQEATAHLALAYADSGRRIEHTGLGRVVDKHSTGGVGDKVSLFVVPAVAACGVPVVKVSGRGLGILGGTVDKLESISGLRLALTADELCATLAELGMVITGQSDELVPGDRATYGIRDVTGTVDSVPLIAASVMSKKIATGAHAVVLDVKYGEGALLADRATAEVLADTMLQVGASAGLDCRAMLTDANQPLGQAVGNALEVREALAALRGEEIAGFSELAYEVAGNMLALGRGDDADLATCVQEVRAAVDSGRAWELMRRWVEWQGGDVAQVDDPDLLPGARHHTVLVSDRAGTLRHVGARAVGVAATRVGAGRFTHDAPLDYGAGVVVLRRAGDVVESGEPLAELHWNDADSEGAMRALRDAFVMEP